MRAARRRGQVEAVPRSVLARRGFRRVHGDLEGERAADPRGALHRHRSAVRLGDAAHDGQPEAGAVAVHALAPVEPVEDQRLLLGADPRPVVLDGKLHAPVGGTHVHEHPAAGLDELDRVDHEVGQRDLHPLPVAGDDEERIRFSDIEGDVLLLRRGARGGHGGLHEVGRRVPRQRQSRDPGVQAREVEEVGGDPLQPGELDLALAEELQARGRVIRRAALQQLVERRQGGDGRAQLVGGVRDEPLE